MYDQSKLKPMNIKIDHSGRNEKIVLFFRRFFIYVILLLLTFISLFAFYILIVNCTRNHYDIQKSFSFTFGNFFQQNWSALFGDTNLNISKALANSIIVSFSSALLAVYFSALTAYAFHKYSFKAKKAIYTFVLMIMMIPTQISSLGLVNLCIRFKMLNTFWPLILPSIASPIVVFYMKQYLDSVLPGEMIEAARVDGTGEIRIFHTMVLPILKPALAIQFIFTFVNSWNNYFVPALILQDSDVKTLPLIIAQLKSSNPETFDLGKVYMLLTIAIIPLLIIYLIFSRFIIKNLTAGSVKE